MVVNKQKLAEILGISEATLTNWQREGLPMVPRGKTGKSNHYETKEVIGWMLARERGTDLTAERTRLAKEQADKLAIENARLRKRLLDRDEVVAVIDRMLIALRTRLLAIPAKFAALVVGREAADVRELLDAEVRNAMQDMADCSLEKNVPSADPGEKAGVINATTKVDSQPMGRQRQKIKPGGKR